MKIDPVNAIGMRPGESVQTPEDPTRLEYVNLKLAALGQPIFGDQSDYPVLSLAAPLLADYQEKSRLLSGHRCPADKRILGFLRHFLKDLSGVDAEPMLPERPLVLDRHGLARMLSIPGGKDLFESDIVKSYRVAQGVLHNPKYDRRTTEGSFHIADGGLPVPADKVAVPKIAYARMLRKAMNPPRELLRLPFTAGRKGHQAELWTSLLLRPMVCPEAPGVIQAKHMECRFFAPGNLVGNLDFVESIFGNAGDPHLPECDAALDVAGWTGHTGCVILAPHLIYCTKKELGLPHVKDASPRQKRDGMCWTRADERYNNGSAFKISARDASGVIVTLIADNYFGYCKKEVKAQISFSANLFGLCEEEHAGGAIAYPSYDLGEDFRLARYIPDVDHTFDEMVAAYADLLHIQPEGYATDRQYPHIHYVPEDAYFSLRQQTISWQRKDGTRSIRLKPGLTYVLPSGYKVEMRKPADGHLWQLVGTTAEGTFCHKPCTVSGGGKSEISKSISDAIIHGPMIVADLHKDFARVSEILAHDFGKRFSKKRKKDSRPILSPQRSLGSVVKLLTPSADYTDAYNRWLTNIPYYIKELVFLLKRLYVPEWGADWQSHFSVDWVNGIGGNELKYRDSKLTSQYLRIGFTDTGAWRTFALRRDFAPAHKLQIEDDISVSLVLPVDQVPNLHPKFDYPGVKFVENCEYRLFQRPDEAIHRGYDKRTERDMARDGNFFCNYEPLQRDEVERVFADVIRFDEYTLPVKQRVRDHLDKEGCTYMVLPSHPRLVDGIPTKNPRYLQNRDDLENPAAYHLARTGTRLYRRVPHGHRVPAPVNAVLAGHRNNPAEEGVRPLCVFNPIHYLPLPEFFMEVISSMTGKSPSTTGAGSEGALTKGPFNALPPVIDLNNALVSYLLTGHYPFITAAGWVGPRYRVDHDISLVVPEVWCRMRPNERHAQYLIQHGMLEKCRDFVHKGKLVPASLLGYRMTEKFALEFFGRLFANPASVFTAEMLRPEMQDEAVFAESMDNVLTTHRRVARLYIEDGSIEWACPPLKALLRIMAEGDLTGITLQDPELRALFDRKQMLASDWYRERLERRREVEIGQWEQHLKYLRDFLQKDSHRAEAKRLKIRQRIAHAEDALKAYKSPKRLKTLRGTLGTDPALRRV